MSEPPLRLKVTLTMELRALPDPQPALERWDLALKRFLKQLKRTYGLVRGRLREDVEVIPPEPGDADGAAVPPAGPGS